MQILDENNNISDNPSYFGCYHKFNEKFASFENVMCCESGDILMSEGESQKVFVSPNLDLTNGVYYSFSIHENVGRLPNAIPNTLQKLQLNPYQDYIRLRFERLDNPEANKMIAKLMREIGKGMYDSKQRMIFELLQNADDAPGKEKVGFHIDISGDYFFIMHDGAPFNKDDVEAITSAAESTKRDDSSKTGYKGIGFKSVFTDSEEVWIKSGGYQFAFLRNSPFFKNFDKFYFSSKRYNDHPEFIDEDKLKFRNQRLRFNGATDIPWQVIPIWQEKLPVEFNDSNFAAYPNPVQFALKIGKENINEYKSAIENIVKRPQFLLFLRNTSKFNSPKNGVLILRHDTKEIIKITKLRGDYRKEFAYTKQVFENIEVSDHAFSELNIGLKKKFTKNEFDIETTFFTDLNGREIDTIPPKLATATLTEISFGILLKDGKLSPEEDYIRGVLKYSSLFTYLPMEDTRFQLPFLVNADFVPSSNRQKIQGDNLWNKYIMIKVAEKHIATLSHYALEFIKDNNPNSSYLSLLLKNQLPEDDTAQQIIDAYNEKYLEQLNVVSIVVNDNNQSQLLSETIIDDSGLIELFGQDIFYEIYETSKRLPHSNLDESYLKEYIYLDVEVIDLEELAGHVTPEICERLGVLIVENSLYETPKLLQWLDKLVIHIPEYFGKIPFILHDSSLFSLECLVTEEDAWLINENTSNYQELLKELSYHIINLNLDEYSSIKEYLHSYKGYVNDKAIAYQRISENSTLSALPITAKLKLIDFFQNSEFMVGIGAGNYFGKLKLFVDENTIPRPLQQLLSRKEGLEVDSIHEYRILENEFTHLTDALQKELIEKEAIFTSFILKTDLFNEWSVKFNSENISTYVNDLKIIYSWVNNTDEISSAAWASIPWLFIDDDLRFLSTDKVYWSNAFYGMLPEDYEITKSILQNAEIKKLPQQSCGDIIKSFKLKTDDLSDVDWTVVKELETLPANTFLDWMELDGNFGSFFEEYTLNLNELNLWSIEGIPEIKIYDSSNKELTNYIQSSENLSLSYTELDGLLCSESRFKIGVLQGDKLLKSLINSGLYNQNLASYLPTQIDWKLLDNFISNLQTLKLNTGIEYDVSSPENIILYSLLKFIDDTNDIPEEVLTTINNLRGKIVIDEQPLRSFDTSNTISFGKGKKAHGLVLSDVLNEYEGESDVLDEILNSFVTTDKRKLRRLIFNNRFLTPQDIHYKIENEKRTFYSEHQVAFQLLDKSYGNNRNWSKQHFDTFYLSQDNKIQIENSYKLLLDILLELPLTKLIDFEFLDFELLNCVDKTYAIESEYIPDWLEDWVSIDQIKRLDFLADLHYNIIDSPIVNFRKSLVAKEYDQNSVIRYFEVSKPNMQMIWNSIEWLSDFNSDIVTRNIAVIKQVNDYIQFSTENQLEITIPVIKAIDMEGDFSYHLRAIDVQSKLLKIDSQNEFTYSIFIALKSSDDNSIFIDNNIGELSEHYNIENIELEESINTKVLEETSSLWQEPFYRKWEFYNDYPIHIYKGNEIPYVRSYNEVIINEFTRDLKVENDGGFYVSKILSKDILDSLPSSFPDDKLTSLKEWERRTLKDPSLIEDNPFEETYNETFDRMIQDRYGISEERQNDENSNAKKQVLYYLEDLGYDVDEGHSENDYAALYNIKDSTGNKLNFIVRSARGGLLYLDKEHWDMLESSDFNLVVIYPGHKPKLFKNRMDLLSEELAEKILFRIPNNKNISELDGIFESLESESHIILVTSEKMKESLFSELSKNKEFNKLEKGAIEGDDFKL
jgi:hypothetical protein